ncbi:WD40 repeat domain-containing protein [Armatimonas sp.]|uniref:WD40 repeat domain-containing protein n=1 Tax=Armatimonas sp. TaxID=1872638 RepID=UPI00286A3665|nr:WD40 repeat domain-containing protein [Armatimonas sp.]
MQESQSQTLLPRQPTVVSALAFSPDGKLLAVIHRGGVRLLDSLTGKLRVAQELSKMGVFGGTFSSRGTLLATQGQLSSGAEIQVFLWETSTLKLIRSLAVKGASVSSVKFSTNGNQVLTTSSDGRVRIWETSTGKTQQTLVHDQVEWATCLPDPERLLSLSSFHFQAERRYMVLCQWNRQTGKLLKQSKLFYGGVNDICDCLALSPDGKLLACGLYSHKSGDPLPSSIQLWDIETGRLIRVLKGHRGGLDSIAFSPDGERLASGSTDKTARVWQVKTGKTLQVLPGFQGSVFAVAFSPDGKRIAAGGYDGSVQVW